MSALLKDAEAIFATAIDVATACDYSILVGDDGAIRMIADADWPLDSLRAHHGARAAYRVQRGPQGVRVEARNEGASCLLTADRPERVLRPPVGDFPRYLMLQ